MMAAVKFDPNVYYCVNALKGATSISTTRATARTGAGAYVSMP